MCLLPRLDPFLEPLFLAPPTNSPLCCLILLVLLLVEPMYVRLFEVFTNKYIENIFINFQIIPS